MRPSPARPLASRATAAIAAALLTLALGALPALAAAPATSRENLPIPEGSSSPAAGIGGGGGTLLRLGLGLVVVVGLIMGVWYVLKRVQRSRYPAVGETRSGLIDVVATTALGPSRALHLVRVGGRLILVGATDHAVTRVAGIDAEEAARLVDLARPGAGPGGPGSAGMDDRARAVATASDATLVERLRNLTTRR